MVSQIATHAIFVVPLNDNNLASGLMSEALNISDNTSRIRTLVNQITHKDERVSGLNRQLVNEGLQWSNHTMHIADNEKSAHISPLRMVFRRQLDSITV